MSSGIWCIALLVALQLLIAVANNCPTYHHTGQNAVIANCTKSPKKINKENGRRPRFEACYRTKVNTRANTCAAGKRMYLRRLKPTMIAMQPHYDINVPSYSNHQLCTFSLPPPQPGHLYTYLLYTYNIEQSSISQCRCLDFLKYEHTEVGMAPAEVLSCGNQIDTRLDGKVLTSDITITFRSNEAVTRSGAHLSIAEFLPNANAIGGQPGVRGRNGEVGERGPEGGRGHRGMPGLRGSKGFAGAPGVKGDIGAPGLPGVAGPIGSEGDDGAKGERGPRGPAGRPCSCSGVPGPPGPPGQPGPPGGPPGPPGPPGSPPGDVGPPGGSSCCFPITGDKGDNGQRGPRGRHGQRGKRGPPGYNGLPGPVGSKGEPGLVGDQGEHGDEGPKGNRGSRGPPGPIGISHCPGISKRDVAKLHSLFDSLDSDIAMIDQGYFDAWRGNQQQYSAGAFTLRHYVNEENDESSLNTISLHNFTEGVFDRSQFNIRRGPVLSVFGMNRKEIVAKLEEYENSVVNNHKKRDTTNQIPGFPTTSSFCPQGYPGSAGTVGQPGTIGLNGERGNRGYPGPRGLEGPAGLSGPTGDNGVHGIEGPQGVKGTSGPKGNRGPPGFPGTPGQCNRTPVGTKGDRGPRQVAHKGSPTSSCLRLKGQKGDPGDPGFSGPRGPDGPSGLRGTPGTPGPYGEKGEIGDKGPKGYKGNPGKIGVAGKLGPPGPPGPPGCACKLFQFFLDEFNFIVRSNNRTNQTVIDTTFYHEFPGMPGPVANSYCVRGPQGVRGYDGPAGPKGYKGVTGRPGNVGWAGSPGSSGEQGAKGERGVTGPQGPGGPRGSTGPKGSPGDRGPRGPPGTSRVCSRNGRSVPAPSVCPPERKGTKGVKGSHGRNGYAGAPGPRGFPGSPGIPGATGRKGEKGFSGHRGQDGPTGPPGSRGNRGPPGYPGPIGSREGCPEFDGIDISLVPPNPAELNAIKKLITEKDSETACSLRDASQPLLQQLAYYYCNN